MFLYSFYGVADSKEFWTLFKNTSFFRFNGTPNVFKVKCPKTKRILIHTFIFLLKNIPSASWFLSFIQILSFAIFMMVWRAFIFKYPWKPSNLRQSHEGIKRAHSASLFNKHEHIPFTVLFIDGVAQLCLLPK